MIRLLFLVSILLFAFVYSKLFSVVTIDRNYILSPLKSSSTTSDSDFFTFTGATAEFGKYFPEPYADFNHFWVSKASVFGEIYRYRDTFSITLFSDIELISSSNSPIFFDPRAFYWQEGILLSHKYDIFNFQFSFTHRCKHDVDNADIVSLSNEVRARVIIWDSLWFRAFTDHLVIHSFDNSIVLKGVPFVRSDFYVLAVDSSVWYRTVPFASYSTYSDYKVNRIVGSVSFGGVLDLELGKNFGFYFKAYQWYDFLADNEIWNWSRIRDVIGEYYLELAFYVRNDGMRMFFFIQNNFQRDPAVEPYDQGSVNLIHFGLKAIDERFSF